MIYHPLAATYFSISEIRYNNTHPCLNAFLSWLNSIPSATIILPRLKREYQITDTMYNIWKQNLPTNSNIILRMYLHEKRKSQRNKSALEISKSISKYKSNYMLTIRTQFNNFWNSIVTTFVYWVLVHISYVAHTFTCIL